MQKKAIIPIWLVMSIMMLLAILFFLWQLKTSSVLRQNLTAKKKELKEAQKASRRLELLEKQSQELQQKEAALAKKVPSTEKEPLSLIKTVTQLAKQKGLRKMSFKIKSSSALTNTPAYPSGINPLYFTLECQATYPQLLEFLKELKNTERVLNLEKIEVKRGEKILPYQEILVSFVTYSF